MEAVQNEDADGEMKQKRSSRRRVALVALRRRPFNADQISISRQSLPSPWLASGFAIVGPADSLTSP